MPRVLRAQAVCACSCRSLPVHTGLALTCAPPSSLHQAELQSGITAEDAAAREAAFFRDDPFWSSADLAALQGRFGVDNLRQELSVQLVSGHHAHLSGKGRGAQFRTCVQRTQWRARAVIVRCDGCH